MINSNKNIPMFVDKIKNQNDVMSLPLIKYLTCQSKLNFESDTNTNYDENTR